MPFFGKAKPPPEKNDDGREFACGRTAPLAEFMVAGAAGRNKKIMKWQPALVKEVSRAATQEEAARSTVGKGGYHPEPASNMLHAAHRLVNRRSVAP